jgi:hypothetical protein
VLLDVFIAIWGILFSVFTWLAFSVKSMKVYLTGCLTALLYFWAVTEFIIYVFHHKVPVIGFMVNPFPGTYRSIVLNLHYTWPYFAVALGVSLLFFIILSVKLKKASIRPLTDVNV